MSVACAASDQGAMPGPGRSRIVGGIPTAWVVIGVPIVVLALTAIFVGTRPSAATRHPVRLAVKEARLLFDDRTDGAVVVRRADDDAVVTVLEPGSHAFVRVVLSGLVRERRREGQSERTRPFRIVRWSDGHLTLDDSATGQPIDLGSFGPDNEAAFSKLLDEAMATRGRAGGGR